MLNNIYIIFQVIFWALIFFWLDFDLFTYILNDHLTIKTILGIILGCSHLFLFRYLFNLVDIDSIYVSDNDNKENSLLNGNMMTIIIGNEPMTKYGNFIEKALSFLFNKWK